MNPVPKIDLPCNEPSKQLQTSPRSCKLTVVDSPRPSATTVRRRLSQTHSSVRTSPLRVSLSESALTKYLPGTAQTATNTLSSTTVTVESIITSCIRESSNDSSSDSSSESSSESNCELEPKDNVATLVAESDESPLTGRLQHYAAPLYLLEQIFCTPGGGIELRQTLGIYSSKSAAERAARLFVDENHDEKHFENTSLFISAVPIDKAASKNHDRQVVHL